MRDLHSAVFAGWAFLFVIIWIVTVVYCFFIPDSSVAYRPVEMTSEVNTEVSSHSAMVNVLTRYRRQSSS